MSEEIKRSPGQPSKYDPKYCDALTEHMAKGLSFETFAAVVGVHRDTLYEWVKAHPEFAEAKEEAFSKCQLFWEQQGVNGLYSVTEYNEKGKPESSKSINATVWIFNMKNRFKWRDKQPDEIDTIVNNNNTAALSDEDLDAKIEEKMKKARGE